MPLYYCKIGEGDWVPWEPWAAETRARAAVEHAVSHWAARWPADPGVLVRVLVCDRVRLAGPTPTWVYDVAVTVAEVTP